MAIFQVNGDERNIIWLPKTASTALVKNSCVGFASGYITNEETEMIGVIKRDVVSTDADYASNTDVPVEIWTPGALYQADIVNGTAPVQATHVGNKYDLDIDTSGYTYAAVDLTETSNKVFTVLKILVASGTAGKVLGWLNGSQWNDNS